MKNTEKENPARRNAYSMAVRNAEEENWMPVVYYDETVSEYSRYTWLDRSLINYDMCRHNKQRSCMKSFLHKKRNH